MLRIWTPLIYQPQLVSKAMQNYLFDWAYDYPPELGEKNTEVNLYYRKGLNYETDMAVQWASNQQDVRDFKEGYKQNGFIEVATTYVRGEILYEGLPKHKHFEYLLLREEGRKLGRYVLVMSTT